jgi:hypothetical protein
MKEMVSVNTKHGCIFSKAIGIMALLIIFFTGVAAASQTNTGYVYTYATSITVPSQFESNVPFNVEVSSNIVENGNLYAYPISNLGGSIIGAGSYLGSYSTSVVMFQ